MPDPLLHLYELALRALDEQERQAAELRGRLAPVLAVSGLAVTLLLPAALSGGGAAQVALAATGLLGVALTIAAATYILRPLRATFSIDARTVMVLVREHASTDETTFLVRILGALDERRSVNAVALARLRGAVTLMLCGLHLSVCGLALAAVVA